MIILSVEIKNITQEVIDNLNDCIVVLDIETTGFSRTKDRIVEFGAIKLKNGKSVDKMSVLINPDMYIPDRVVEVHGITNEMVRKEPTEDYFVPKIAEFLSDAYYIVGHNVRFDLGFITEMFHRNGRNFECEYLDTCALAKKYIKGSENYKLGTLAKYLNIDVKVAHRALADVETTVQLLRYLAYYANK